MLFLLPRLEHGLLWWIHGIARFHTKLVRRELHVDAILNYTEANHQLWGEHAKGAHKIQFSHTPG